MTEPITNVCKPSVVLPKVAEKSKGTPESSPEGHWSKNFAAFAVHRRKDWAVSVKGFNNFVWDFEGKANENEYGMFASHGAMLIANDEIALKAHDVNHGWDWTKIPGATTISLELDLMKDVSTRNFGPASSMAGGVTFKGTERLANGVFGMLFKSPKYKMKNRPRRLSFKKSFFFFQNLIVCLGSSIKLKRPTRITRNQEARTTVFQDKLDFNVASSFIRVNGNMEGHGSTLATTTPRVPDGKSHVSLVDTKGNSYYIPESSVSGLKVHVIEQPVPNRGMYYATAWFEHGAGSKSYEYAAYVKTPSYETNTTKLWQEQDKNDGLYTVMKQDRKAHVVKFLNSFVGSSTPLTNPVYGYVIFDPKAKLPSTGPIKKVSEKCLLMAQETSDSLHLSVSYPDLDFSVSSNFKGTFKTVKKHEMYQSESQPNSITVTLNNLHVTANQVLPLVHGQHSDYSPDIRVFQPVFPSTDGEVVFDNLVNGFSTEVILPKYDTSVHSRRWDILSSEKKKLFKLK